MSGTDGYAIGRATAFLSLLKSQLQAWLCAAADLLFLSSSWAGAVIVLTLLWQPHQAVCAALALTAAWIMALLTGLDEKGLCRSVPAFNALLVGLAVGHYWPGIGSAYPIAIAAGAASLLLAHAMLAMLTDRAQLPVLSLPFVLLSWLLHLLSSQPLASGQSPAFTALPPGALELGLQTLGGVFYLPQASAGAVLALLLCWYSRVLFILAAWGYTLGLAWHLALGGTPTEPALFNYPLVAMAIGGFFLLPSWRSLLLASIAVSCCAILLRVFDQVLGEAGLPIHALPYNLVTLLTLAALGRGAANALRREWSVSPEGAIEVAALYEVRGNTPTVSVPYQGRWIVWQGFDGTWTHQGPWRHGMDFVLVGENGASYNDTGTELPNYYSWLQPVLSPVRGVVVAARGDLPDSPPGQADTLNNWGNHVILRDDRGFFVEISHLAQHSLAAAIGARVEPGDFLGRCGNSGYAIYPHIHMQVQAIADLGAATLDCRVLACDDRGEIAARVPRQGEHLRALALDPQPGIEWHLGETIHFIDRGARRSVQVAMCADDQGTHFLEASGARLEFLRDGQEWRVLKLHGHHPFLEALAQVLPRLPKRAAPGMFWSEQLPGSWCLSGWRLALAQTASIVDRSYALASYRAQYLPEGRIEVVIQRPTGGSVQGAASFDQRGLYSLQLGNQHWQRANATEPHFQPIRHNPWWPLATNSTEHSS